MPTIQRSQPNQLNQTPTNRDKIYVWEAGDTFALIALKYRRHEKDYLEVLDLNRRTLQNNNYIMREGDLIQIPDHWFPLRAPNYNVVIVGSWGRRLQDA